MKMRNKKTGEIVKFSGFGVTVVGENGKTRSEIFESLAELNREWEDYKEPNNPCFINWFREVSELLGHISDREIEKLKEAGNYFETKEEAEKAVKKLKAWKRLEDIGFRVNNWVYALEGNRENGSIPIELKAECKVKTPHKDLNLLFGGEE